MDKRQRKKFDKLLFNMLARNPAEFRLVGDGQGWIPIRDLHKALLEEGLFKGMTPAGIQQHVLLFRPKGLQVSDGKIRALPEYVEPGIFEYRSSMPPHTLFMPIRPRAVFHVENHGLTAPKEKGWLILFSSRKDALLYGKRFHNQPVLCKIRAEEANRDGVGFRYAGGGLYLSKRIERQWLILPQVKEGLGRESKDAELSGGRSPAEKGTLKAPAMEGLKNSGTFFPSVESFEALFQKNANARSRKRFRKKSRYIDRKKKRR